ncbi:hypothetical protein QYH69_25205 [Paraburkholderia sp. SARCC-3016]|uniref:hypothetical protein n=1 Tax=Paraburkholderia sp. SARCC-3016 TaxID=3058611 RepID=UPI002807BF19|nr:hypothetical protein [Paraburkholderia sp. SARCC-3016]MDQ7980540.1 hypothetical protein [Paraburkholderia sp. SARCC-3016]
MTTGKEKARRLARGQGQAIAHFGAQFGAQLVVQLGAQLSAQLSAPFTRRRAARYVAQPDGLVLSAAARRPEPLNLGSTGRSAG